MSPTINHHLPPPTEIQFLLSLSQLTLVFSFYLIFSSLCCRLQDKGAACQDQHLHQDPGAGRGAGLCGDRAEGGRGPRQAGDPLRRRALLPDPRLPQEQHQLNARLWPAGGQHARPDHHSGARPLSGGGSSRRAERGHH